MLQVVFYTFLSSATKWIFGYLHSPSQRAGIYHIARLVCDEFTVLLEGISDEAVAAQIIGNLHHQLTGRFLVAGQEIILNAKTGLAFCQDSHTTPWITQSLI